MLITPNTILEKWLACVANILVIGFVNISQLSNLFKP